MNIFRQFVPAAAVLASVVLAARPAHAQFGGMGGMGGGFGNFAPGEPGELGEYPVKVETVGGTITGTIRLSRVYLQCDLGAYSLRASKIKEIRFPAAGPEGPYMGGRGQYLAVRALVTVVSGDQIQGSLLIEDWKVQTDLGTLTLVPGTLKALVLTGDPKPVPRPGPAKAAASKKAESDSESAPSDPAKSPQPSSEPKR